MPARKPRVIMVGPDPQVMGGISGLALYYLSSELPQRVELRYVSSHEDGSKLHKARVGLRGLGQLWGELLRGPPDLLHLHLSDDASFYRKSLYFWSAVSRGVPVLVHLHGPRFHRFAVRDPATRRLVRLLLDRAARVLVLSRGWKERLAALTSNPEVHVLYNPTSLARFPEDPPLRRPGEPRLLLFMGLLGERKGLHVLREALERLMPDHPELHVLLAGNGEVEETRAWAARFPWGERVEVPGWLRGEAKWDAFRRADLFTLPSYDEGLPLSVLEAMAAGCAIVTTPVGGIPEAVTDGQEALLVPPGDAEALAGAIERLLEQPELARSLGLAGRRRVAEHFDLAPHVRALLGHYEAVLGRSLT